MFLPQPGPLSRGSGRCAPRCPLARRVRGEARRWQEQQEGNRKESVYSSPVALRATSLGKIWVEVGRRDDLCPVYLCLQTVLTPSELMLQG